jgi:hypothetical protein
MDGQTLNLNTDFMNGYTTIFIKLIIAIIIIYGLVMVVNFMRDRYINEKSKTTNSDYLELLLLLHKIFIFSGWGFITGSLVQILFKQFWPSKNSFYKNLQGDYYYLIFGVIIIFVGISFNKARKVILDNRNKEK